MATDNKGFTLPNPDQGKLPARPNVGTTTPIPVDPSVGAPGAKGLLTGGLVLLVVMGVFFFLKGMYANHLVSKKVPPTKANQAGWWLWVFLSALAAGAIFAIVDQARFLTILYLAPLGVVAIVALILMLISSR